MSVCQDASGFTVTRTHTQSCGCCSSALIHLALLPAFMLCISSTVEVDGWITITDVYILTCHFMSPFLPHPLYFFALHHMLLEQCIWHQQNSDHTAYSFTFQQITAFVKAVIFCLISFPRCLFCFSAGVCAFSLCVHTCINQCGDKHLSHILVTHLFSEVKVCCHNLNHHVFLD